jgi:hypothetical protein
LALLFLIALAAFAQNRDPLPVPDLPGFQTLKADFHMHTVFSDGDVWPTIRVQEAWRDGLDVISITDHDDYHPKKEDVGTDLARPYALASEMAAQLGILLVPGIEITKGNLHCNALFVKDFNVTTGLDLTSALSKVKAQQSYVFWNHPGWRGRAEWYPVIDAAHKDGQIQGIELVNGLSFYDEAYPWVEEKKLAIFANSDVHRLISDYAPRTRPVTLVFVRSRDLDGVREALLARRTAAWMGGELWGAEAHLKGLWEGAVRVENPEVYLTPSRRFGLRLNNQSAIPFRLKVANQPAWLQVRGGELRAETVTGLVAQVTKAAPSGRHKIAVQIEFTNLHTGPGRNLTASIPLEIVVP